MNQNHNGVLHLTQRVLDMLQAQSPSQERHECQLQGLEAVGQDPDQELGVVELLLPGHHAGEHSPRTRSGVLLQLDDVELDEKYFFFIFVE